MVRALLFKARCSAALPCRGNIPMWSRPGLTWRD